MQRAPPPGCQPRRFASGRDVEPLRYRGLVTAGADADLAEAVGSVSTAGLTLQVRPEGAELRRRVHREMSELVMLGRHGVERELGGWGWDASTRLLTPGLSGTSR